ncbi:MAG: hypothetical protein PUE04_03270 [Lachnospira sp.]|nr:hypothetical protein [Lachnospira sp.]
MRKTNLLLRWTSIFSVLLGILLLAGGICTALSSRSAAATDFRGVLDIYLDRLLTWDAIRSFGGQDMMLASIMVVFGVIYLLLGVSGLTNRRLLSTVISAALIVLLVITSMRTGYSLLISADFLLMILYFIGSLHVSRR